MNYSKFTIQYYRSFQDIQTLRFANPDSEKLGSGLTFIVGENNTGKTTLIEGLFLYDQQYIRSSEKQSMGEPVFILYGNDELIKRKLQLIRKGSYTLTEDPKINGNEAFEIIPSRRHWQSNASGNGGKIEAIIQGTSQQTPRSHISSTQISYALKDIESDNVRYKNFIEFVRKVIPNFSSFAIGYEENEFIEYVNKDNIRHKSDFLGDGVISILRILAHLFLNNNRPLIIDEPELSLHPTAQKRLFRLIAECSRKRQIIISTHSPYFVSWEYIKNGAVLNKITKHEDKKSEIYHLGDYSKYEKLVNGANWQQPFLMDIVAKEIFFHDNFLFVEGQEDVGLLKKESEFNEIINLFGYGVRGKNDFEFALQLAKDLGIKRAGVIIDAGKEEMSIVNDLKTKFPEYKIIQWNKEDIRDKKEYYSKEKFGYFDKDGNKKSLEQLDDYDKKIQEINEYFLSNDFIKK